VQRRGDLGQNPGVQVQRLSAANGFIVRDIEAAEASVGVVRLAPKVLRDGAVLLARSVTYSFASFGVSRRAGASAAINAKPDKRDSALSAWIDEVRPLAEGNHLRLWPGVGVEADDLAPLGWDVPDPDLTARGALAAAGAVLAAPGGGGAEVTGRKLAVVGPGPVADAARAAVPAAGAELVDGGCDAEAVVVLVAGKAGCLDHETAASVSAGVVVPLTPVPVTARALAVLGRQDAVVVPDFLATAAPLLALDRPDTDPGEMIGAPGAGLASEGPGMWLAAATAAEEHLATWPDERPFGRPLA
jgi:hypothetical protein